MDGVGSKGSVDWQCYICSLNLYVLGNRRGSYQTAPWTKDVTYLAESHNRDRLPFKFVYRLLLSDVTAQFATIPETSTTAWLVVPSRLVQGRDALHLSGHHRYVAATDTHPQILVVQMPSRQRLGHTSTAIVLKCGTDDVTICLLRHPGRDKHFECGATAAIGVAGS